MDNIEPTRKHIAQKKYRKVQSHKGLVRFEIQVSEKTKARFDEMVKAAAEEIAQPWDPRQRLAKARQKVFDDMTQGTAHEFFALKDQIQALKAEIEAISPRFFHTPDLDKVPLPESIKALPDDPNQLKALLAKSHREAQQAIMSARRYKDLAEQQEKLYQTASDYNDVLQRRLDEAGLFRE